MSSNAARAWPNFVPRVEFDAGVSHLQSQLGEFKRRVERLEDAKDQMHADVSTSIDSYRREFEEQLQSFEQHVDHQIDVAKDGLLAKLEDVKEYAAPQADVGPQLSAHHRAIDSLERGIAEAGLELKRLDDYQRGMSDFNKLTYASKVEHEDALKRHESSHAASLNQARHELNGDIDSIRSDIVDLKKESAMTKEDLVLSGSVTSSCLDCLKKDVEALQKICNADIAMRQTVKDAEASIAGLKLLSATAMQDRSILHEEIEHERDVVRRTLAAWQKNAEDVLGALSKIHAFESLSKELMASEDSHDRKFESLDVRESNHFEDVMLQQKKASDQQQILKNEHEALRAEFVQHVAWTNSIVDQLRQQKLDLAFEQMDKAIGLQKSVEKVEQGHQEIHRTLRGIQLPSLG